MRRGDRCCCISQTLFPFCLNSDYTDLPDFADYFLRGRS